MAKNPRPVAIVSFAQADNVRREEYRNEVETLLPVVTEVLGKVGLTKNDMEFVCSGSTDYLVGAPFSFVAALDAVGAWPPLRESHVEMDGAFALHEAWLMLQSGDADTALVYSFGRSSHCELDRVLALQLDPYYMAPLWPDPVAVAALQARELIDSGKATEEDFAKVAERNRKAATSNPSAQKAPQMSVSEMLAEDYIVSPLRRHAVPPITDGAAAIVLVAEDRARQLCSNPAWILGVDHRIETHSIGARDLTESPSTRLAAVGAGLDNGAAAQVDVAEIHAPFAHQEIIVTSALGIDPDAGKVNVNPSGGASNANAMMVAGLIRIGEAANRVMDGSAKRALAHATSGPCLQQNLICSLADNPGGA
ncbi:MAG: thiolase domain-containing protein [Acidimicrobiales bacterium]